MNVKNLYVTRTIRVLGISKKKLSFLLTLICAGNMLLAQSSIWNNSTTGFLYIGN